MWSALDHEFALLRQEHLGLILFGGFRNDPQLHDARLNHDYRHPLARLKPGSGEPNAFKSQAGADRSSPSWGKPVG